MSKSNDNLLLWGAAAVAAYFIFKPKAATTVTPLASNTPAIITPTSSGQPNPISSLTNAASSFISKIFTPQTPTQFVQPIQPMQTPLLQDSFIDYTPNSLNWMNMEEIEMT